MTPYNETPSSILYADLRTFGGISNTSAARVLLSDKVSFGGKSPRDRVDSRTYLSREVVHVAPSRVNPAVFAEFPTSTQTLYARVLSHVGDASLVGDHYAHDAADDMCAALYAHGLETQVYRNEVARLRRVRLRNDKERPLLLMMLFCITGCLADAHEATLRVEAFARNMLAQDLATVVAGSGEARSITMTGAPYISLGLLREVGGTAVPPIIPLDPDGSTVGALATGPGAITNVGPDVSRRHARIWFDGKNWLCEGLGSTNGTSIIYGGDGTVMSIEPPRGRRADWATYPPCEIHDGDVLIFGQSTKFRVLNVHGQALS